MKIAIGPIEGHYGGAAQHILNIINHSRYDFTKIEIPLPLLHWGRFYRNNILPVQKRLGIGLKHSDKRFDAYGLQKFFDIPGFVMSRFTLKDYDAVHLHGHPYWEQLYNERNKNLVYTIHNLYSRDDFSQEWQPTIDMLTENMIKICKRSKTVISVAKWLKESLKSRHGVDSVYIPNGVNLKEFEERNSDEFRLKFGIKEDFYLFVGRATKYKRPELFVELARKMPKRKFIMVGRGITQENMQDYLKSRLPSNLQCIGEPERKDVVNAFDACRAFVLPSANETFGIVLLEAMASSKPVLAANNLGPAEIIQNGKTGFLFDKDNLENLIVMAEKAWNGKKEGIAGRELVEREYDWKKIVPRIDKIYIS